jgi:hypothetical protein
MGALHLSRARAGFGFSWTGPLLRRKASSGGVGKA